MSPFGFTSAPILDAVATEHGDVGRPFQRVVHSADETVTLASACESQDLVTLSDADHVKYLSHVHLLNAHRSNLP